jgi:hypothetical protein
MFLLFHKSLFYPTEEVYAFVTNKIQDSATIFYLCRIQSVHVLLLNIIHWIGPSMVLLPTLLMSTSPEVVIALLKIFCNQLVCGTLHKKEVPLGEMCGMCQRRRLNV